MVLTKEVRQIFRQANRQTKIRKTNRQKNKQKQTVDIKTGRQTDMQTFRSRERKIVQINSR